MRSSYFKFFDDAPSAVPALGAFNIAAEDG
jgi:hypothetical protein